MNRLPDGIWIINADATTLYAKAAMGDIQGVEAARLIGEPSFDYVFAKDVRRNACSILASGETRRRFTSNCGARRDRRSGSMCRDADEERRGRLHRDRGNVSRFGDAEIGLEVWQIGKLGSLQTSATCSGNEIAASMRHESQVAWFFVAGSRVSLFRFHNHD
jgi:PAS domain-containing protein